MSVKLKAHYVLRYPEQHLHIIYLTNCTIEYNPGLLNLYNDRNCFKNARTIIL